MKQRVISINYVLKNAAGDLLDASDEGEAFSYIEGSKQIIPALETAVQAMKDGEKKTVSIPAADAYGERDDKLLQKVERSRFPDGAQLQVGDMFRGGEEGEPRIYTVKEVSATHVVVDGNHPLAGENLVFDVQLISKRDATAEEISHGHVHGPGGHHHH